MSDNSSTPDEEAQTDQPDDENGNGEELKETYQNRFGTIIPTSMVTEMEKSYLDYAMSVIVSRALPDVRDGLKPVHRRILFAMKGLGLTYNTPFKKCARIVGEVLGKYHPHGDTAVYDALVRLAQDFSMRYPLIKGQGNFGSVDGDSPAAMRYTEAKLSAITEELLTDIDKETVEFAENFDGSQTEPTVLPGKLPNLLLMGTDGIAVGMATKIPPHNLKELTGAITTLIEKGKSETPDLKIPKENVAEFFTEAKAETISGKFESQAQIEDLLNHVKGPDFPTGATIFDAATIKEIYATGRGKIVVRATAQIQEDKKGRFQIIISDLPYQVNKAKLVAKIADLVKAKKVTGIANLRDESDREGLRVVVDLKKDSRPKSVLNNLYKHTPLQDTFSANIVALNSQGTPQLMNLKTILTEYIRHRQLVITKRSQFELKAARARAHILEGLLIALDHLDEVIDTIRKSPDADIAKSRLMKKFKLTEIQSTAILDMQLRKLAALERKKIEDEYKAIKQTIDQLIAILSRPAKILKLITQDLKELSDKYGDARKTRVIKSKISDFREEDLVPSENCIITVTETGYIKRMPVGTYRSQRRGGKGVSGMTTKLEDAVKYLITANTHDNMFVFTNRGRVFKLRVYELPEGSRQAKGQAIINLINIHQGEEIKAMITSTSKLDEAKDQYIFLATKKGMIKRTSVNKFQNIRTSGIIAITLKKEDELVWGQLTRGQDHIILVSHFGKSIRFKEADVRPTARDTQGVRGINLKPGDFVVAAESLNPQAQRPADKRKKFFRDFLIVTENGLGKRTPVASYPLQKRGGQGVKVANLSGKTGNLAAAAMVTQEDHQVVITTEKAQVIKLPLRNIPQLNRPTQGVILMRNKKGDKVRAITTIPKPKEESDN